jgi:NAD(P)-dependent dehydrogenase (short-subunit alcohol dehydrogenase family)
MGLGLGALAALGAGALVGLRALRRERVEFSGRTVFITGGSRGLGLLLARHFLQEGARVALCSRDNTELERASAWLEGVGSGEVLAVACNVGDRAQVEAAVAQVHERFGAVDVLVNNAGVIQVGPLESMTEEDFAEAMGVHFWGSLYATWAVLPEMKRRGFGRIVNITSIGGRLSMPHLLPYNASKFAQVGLSDGLRAELMQDGIRVTTVCPGLMRTGSPRNAFFKGDHRAEHTWFTLGDSLPLLSMSAERAARKIVEACRRGQAELVLGLPAKVAVLARTLAPGLTAAVLAATNRLLPQEASPERHKGSESETPLTRSWVTGLTQRAARQHNEVESPVP